MLQLERSTVEQSSDFKEVDEENNRKKKDEKVYEEIK